MVLMKKGIADLRQNRFFAVFILLLNCFFISACASTAAGKSKEQTNALQEEPLFEDWQYRGFGSEYPAWCEVILLNKDFKELKDFFPEIQNQPGHFYCSRVGAHTVDSCSATLTNEDFLNTGDKILAKTWVKINPYYEQFDIPYYSLILFFRDTQEDSQ